MTSWPGNVFLVGSFLLSMLSISSCSLLACKVSAEKFSDKTTGVPLNVKVFLLLLSRFSLHFWNFNYDVSQRGSLWIHVIVLCGPPESGCLIFSRVWEVFSHYFIEKPFCLFFSLPSGTRIMNLLILLMVSHSLSYRNSVAFFPFCSSDWINSAVLSLSLLHPFSHCI